MKEAGMIPKEALSAATEAVMAIDGPATLGSAEVVAAALEAAAPWLRAQALEDAADDLDGEFAQIRAAQDKPFTWLCGIADAELHLRARAVTERGQE